MFFLVGFFFGGGSSRNKKGRKERKKIEAAAAKVSLFAQSTCECTNAGQWGEDRRQPNHKIEETDIPGPFIQIYALCGAVHISSGFLVITRSVPRTSHAHLGTIRSGCHSRGTNPTGSRSDRNEIVLVGTVRFCH